MDIHIAPSLTPYKKQQQPTTNNQQPTTNNQQQPQPQAVYPKRAPALLFFVGACMMDSSGRSLIAERGTGSARRRRERRLRAQWRHEQQTVAMALAAATHHSAQRGEWRDLHEAPRGQRTASHGARRRVWPGIPSSSRCTRKNSGARGRVQRRTVEQIVDTKLIVPSLDVPVPQRENQLVEVCRQLDIHIPEQAIEVPKISSSRPPRRRRVRFAEQTAEQLVEVPTIISYSSLREIMEQNVDIPVPHGRGGRVGVRSLQGFPGQSSTAFGEARYFPAATAEQIVDTLVPCGDRTLHPASSSSVLPVTANQGVFSTFPRGEESTQSGSHSGSELSRARPRRRLSWHRRFFMRASGRTMLVVCGCSFPVVGGNFWAWT